MSEDVARRLAASAAALQPYNLNAIESGAIRQALQAADVLALEVSQLLDTSGKQAFTSRHPFTPVRRRRLTDAVHRLTDARAELDGTISVSRP